jgi:hypothetical protein
MYSINCPPSHVLHERLTKCKPWRQLYSGSKYSRATRYSAFWCTTRLFLSNPHDYWYTWVRAVKSPNCVWVLASVLVVYDTAECFVATISKLSTPRICLESVDRALTRMGWGTREVWFGTSKWGVGRRRNSQIPVLSLETGRPFFLTRFAKRSSIAS